MVQFNLPDNSKLIKGEDYLLPAEIKNKKKKNATIPNLNERERKGLALSIMILLVIKAEDQSTTKINGIILKILFSLK